MTQRGRHVNVTCVARMDGRRSRSHNTLQSRRAATRAIDSSAAVRIVLSRRDGRRVLVGYGLTRGGRVVARFSDRHTLPRGLTVSVAWPRAVRSARG